MTIKLKYLSVIILVCLNLFGQDPDKHLFYISTDFASNTNTFGITETTVKQPNFITTINFVSKQNYDLGYSNVITFNSDTSLSKPSYENDLFCGYTFNLNDKWSIYPTYTHMFHSKGSQTYIATFTDVFQGDLSYYGDSYNGSLNLEYYLGANNMFFSSFQSALGFSKDDLFLKNSVLEIQLGFYLNLSDINYYNESIYDNYKPKELISWVQTNYPELETFVKKRLPIDGLETTKTKLKEIINISVPGVFKPEYKLSSFDLYLPISYNVGNFMFIFMATANVPLADTQFYKLENTFMFNAGISYAFYLK